MATATKKAKAHALLKNNEPAINPMDYTRTLMAALNYYNVNHNEKEKIDWFKSHFGKKIDFNLNLIDGFYVRTAGTLCRILDNGNALDERDESRLQKEFADIRNRCKATKPVEVDAPKPIGPSIQDRMQSTAEAFMAEFNAAVDEFITTGSAPKIDNLVVSTGLKGPALRIVAKKIERTKSELETAVAGSDKYLNEAYSNFKKAALKKLLGLYETLDKSLGQAKVVVRKTRITKAKPPVQIVKGLKFQKESKELGLVSITPAKIVGATKLFVYNTKRGRLIAYEAVEGTTLSVKGTTLINFDTEASIQKSVRKPDALKSLSNQGVRSFNKFFKELKAKPLAVTGRIGEDCVLLGVF